MYLPTRIDGNFPVSKHLFKDNNKDITARSPDDFVVILLSLTYFSPVLNLI